MQADFFDAVRSTGQVKAVVFLGAHDAHVKFVWPVGVEIASLLVIVLFDSDRCVWSHCGEQRCREKLVDLH